MTEDMSELRWMVTNFYKNLYTSEGVHNVDSVLQHVSRKVTPAMNEILCAPFSAEEVKIALFQMFPT
jgi:hypothetical protein